MFSVDSYKDAVCFVIKFIIKTIIIYFLIFQPAKMKRSPEPSISQIITPMEEVVVYLLKKMQKYQ
jgi:hypothetical protein